MNPELLLNVLLQLQNQANNRKQAECAFNQIEAVYYPRMVCFLTNSGVERSEAESIANSVLMLLWDAPEKFDVSRVTNGRYDRLFWAWLQQILIHRRTDYFRALKRQKRVIYSDQMLDFESEHPDLVARDSENALDDAERAGHARELIRKFKKTLTVPQQRMTMVLMETEGVDFKLDLLMTICGISRPDACKLRKRVQKKFRQFLQQQGMSEA
ncbi:RNA polymerase sigma factor [Tuwongella immobilis]|uniref:Rna polymerase sigma factor n=1 Tax=Tuwongella immobilis TaxID=692036 RepID=A0A6C2YIG9_9BACT|nr:sigma-70 family RNA polymerase sigma factor [Tuwongella immobilis]VIP01164.1 rna polymerase sigma factor : [Tuwongella immobilis]VTR97754.1 rna polymerase sigma factor : [Tuwongella immobilis]